MIIGGRLAGLLLTLGLASLATSAFADDRLVSHAYDPAEVVRINGKLGVQATIGFEEDEKIENVAVGDSAKWQITPNKRANLLFVKPLEASARTNMTVVTDKRTYFFDLVASPAAKPVYMLRFTYAGNAPPSPALPPITPSPIAPAITPVAPAVAQAAPAASLAELPPLGLPPEQQARPSALAGAVAQQAAPPVEATPPAPTPAVDAAPSTPQIAFEQPFSVTTAPPPPDPVEQRIVSGDPVSAPADPATLNFAWSRKGDTALLPSRIYDDGEATFLTWPAQRPVPAILIRNDKGEEGPVNYAVRGDTIVIDGVPGLIVLRAGRKNATLRNLRGDGQAGINLEPADRTRHTALAGLPSAFVTNRTFSAAFIARPLQR